MSVVIAWIIAALSATIGLLFGGAAIQRKRTARQQGRREQALKTTLDLHGEEMQRERNHINSLGPAARERAIGELSQRALDEWFGRHD